MIDLIRADTRYALRFLRRNPSFACLSVAGLAIAIGINTSVFGVINAVILNPLPYKSPERLVMVWATEQKSARLRMWSPDEVAAWQHHPQIFNELAAYGGLLAAIRIGAERERVETWRVSPSLFSLLGVSAALGRVFLADEQRPGHEQVAILSHRLWTEKLSADAAIIGKPARINDNVYMIVGVMPKGFTFPGDADIWIPLVLNSGTAVRGYSLRLVGRLGDGVELAAAQKQAEQAIISDEFSPNRGVRLVSLHEQVTGKARHGLMLLGGAAFLVLLIACVTIANMLLVRSTARDEEIAVRQALGASLTRVAMQLANETIILFVIGGLIGVALCLWTHKLLISMIPADVPRVGEIGINLSVAAFAAIITIVTGLVASLAPISGLNRHRAWTSLTTSSRTTTTAARGHVRDVLVVCEIAGVLVLMISSGLLIQSFLRLRSVEVGFDASHLLAFRVSTPGHIVASSKQTTRLVDELLARIRKLPSVADAAAVTALPFSNTDLRTAIRQVESVQQAQELMIPIRFATATYFRTLSNRLVEGREFTEAPGQIRPASVIINASLKRLFWPDEPAVGKHVHLMGAAVEVVGVVDDMHHGGLRAPVGPEVFLPITDAVPLSLFVVIRTWSDPSTIIQDIRAAARGVDDTLVISSVATMEQLISQSASNPRFYMVLISLFAFTAAALATIGIYGVMSFAVQTRRVEIGIRMALGARPVDVMWVILRRATGLTALGLFIGLAIAQAFTRLLSSMLFEIQPTDVRTWALVTLLVAAVALVAGFVPAFSAARFDPVRSLRYQ